MKDNSNQTHDKELELINKHSSLTLPLTRDNVYTFTFKLCDNEIDKNGECFSEETLREIAKMSVGKRGYIREFPESIPHKCMPIIYDWQLVTDSVKKTSYGVPYCLIIASAFIFKCKETEGFIVSLKSHNAREVSLGVGIVTRECSICGQDTRAGSCRHKAGKTYNGVLCYHSLKDVNEFYEWQIAIKEIETKDVKRDENKEQTCCNPVKELLYKCSSCGYILRNQKDDRWSYCPSCGKLINWE